MAGKVPKVARGVGSPTMLKYILRRTWQMVPTILGVILITFVLFNVVGGSPAAMTLGKHVSPKQLEEFDEQRGFNKPLLFGWWTRTRALGDTTFEANAGIWNAVEGASYVAPGEEGRGRVVLPADGSFVVPVAFALPPDTEYRWQVVCRMPDGGSFRLVRREKADDEKEAAPPGQDLANETNVESWKRVSLRFTTAADTLKDEYLLVTSGGALEIASVSLRRKVANPLDSQFIFYLKQLARLDFGVSNSTNQRVSRMLLDGVIPSLTLTVPIFIVGLATALSLSLVCAFFRDRFLDRFFVVVSVALMSINYIVWIIVGQYFLGFKFGWFPVWGYESWSYLVLPVIIGIVSGLGSSIRFYRTIMLDEMYLDYVRTAFAKGVSKTGVLFKHVLKNAMIPIITNVVIAIPFLYTGSLLLESFFGIPGLGYMAINAINSSDVDVIRAIVFIGAVMFVIANLVTDICYALVDPRVELR